MTPSRLPLPGFSHLAKKCSLRLLKSATLSAPGPVLLATVPQKTDYNGTILCFTAQKLYRYFLTKDI